VTCKISFPEVHSARMLYELEPRNEQLRTRSSELFPGAPCLRFSISDITVDLPGRGEAAPPGPGGRYATKWVLRSEDRHNATVSVPRLSEWQQRRMKFRRPCAPDLYLMVIVVLSLIIFALRDSVQCHAGFCDKVSMLEKQYMCGGRKAMQRAGPSVRQAVSIVC
jgi:hypothetical protein